MALEVGGFPDPGTTKGIDEQSGFGITRVSYSDVYACDITYEGNVSIESGVIHEDADFVDATNNDFHLQVTSPCINTGDPNPIYDDPDGTRADMGAYYYPYPPMPPEVALVVPDGGEQWRGGSSQTITYTATDETGLKANSLYLWYSTNEGSSYPFLITSEAALTGTPPTYEYSWTIPSISTADAMVKVTVSDIGDAPATDESSAKFTIDSDGPAAPVLVTPTDESTTTNTTPTLTWEASVDDLTGIASYEIHLDDTLITQDATTSYTPGTPLALGVHTWEVKARDGAGNWGNYSTAFSFSIEAEVLSTVVTNCADSGPGSLRQVIINANTLAGPDTISFNIPTTEAGYNTGAGFSWWKIQPASNLPAVTDEATIAGETQATFIGGDPNPYGPEIEIDGSLLSGWWKFGISLEADNCVVSHLAINNFAGVGYFGIYAYDIDNSWIRGCYLGADVTGETAAANTTAIYLDGGCLNTVIGTTEITGVHRNLISGNDNEGIHLLGGSGSTVIIGNYIGTNRTGTAAIANNRGIYIQGTNNNTIGNGTPGGRNIISGNNAGIQMDGNSNEAMGNYIGTDVNGTAAVGNAAGIVIMAGYYSKIGDNTAGGRNIISGNTASGIRLFSSNTRYVEVKGNYIGTGVNGTADLGNGGDGIWNQSSSYHWIAHNLIAFNGGGSYPNGVQVTEPSVYVHISRNSMEANSEGGIALWAGAQAAVPYPVITSAYHSAGIVSLTGTSTVGATIEIFKTEDTPDASGQGEGWAYLGSAEAAAGTWSTTVAGLGIGDEVTATASIFSGSYGFTSEFAMNMTVEAYGAPSVEVSVPDGGEQWRGGSVQNITFTATSAAGIKADSLYIWYSSDEGSTYSNLITSDAAVVSPYSWTVPSISTADAMVRVTVSDIGDLLGTDESVAKFTIDSTPPSAPILVTPPDTSSSTESTPTLTWEASVDDLTGVASYEIHLDDTLITQDATTSYTPGSPLSLGLHTWEVKARDGVGNWGSYSASFTFTVTLTTPEVSTLTISDTTTGSTLYSNSLTVNLDASFSAGAPNEMRLAEDSGFTINDTGWIAFVDPTQFTFLPGEGLRTVYYIVRDALLNESSVASGEITVDTISPEVQAILLSDRTSGSTIESNELTVSLEATGVSLDAVSMRIAQNNTFTENSTGWISYVVTSEYTFTAGNGSRTAYFQVRDPASNESNIVSDSIIVNTTVPTLGSLVLSDRTSGNTQYSNDLTISVEAFGVAGAPVSIRLAEDSGFSVNDTGWLAFENPAEYTLLAGDGTRTVYYKLRDALLNESAPYSAQITIDTARPTVASVTPADGARDVAVSTAIIVEFSEAMSRETVENAFSFSALPGSFSWSVDSKTMTFATAADLEYQTSYAVSIEASAADLA
ncbi:Ig-like domain-containing protein, partial [Candidatus Margulisiibacteriota bacterium]